MKTFNEIKSEFESKNYSLTDIRKSIIFYSIVSIIFTETFIFIVSSLPFLAGVFILSSFYGYSVLTPLFYLTFHLIFYVFFVKKEYKNGILPAFKECKMIIEALKEIKSEKY